MTYKLKECKKCKTLYHQDCYASCPNCNKPMIGINASTKTNADNIKEFYKLK